MTYLEKHYLSSWREKQRERQLRLSFQRDGFLLFLCLLIVVIAYLAVH